MLLCNKRLLMTLIDYMTSFAAGALIATVVFHIYPEAMEYLEGEPEWKTATCFIAGLVMGMLVEQGLHMVLHGQGVGHSHGPLADDHSCGHP